MKHEHADSQIDYGTGRKKLDIYLLGLLGCIILTLCAFYSVMSGGFAKWETFVIIYSAAILQFLIQVVCFLRLNTQTEQGRINVMTFIFTGVILLTIVAGSLWIMHNLDYNMLH